MSYPDMRGDWRKWEQECADVEPRAYGAPILPQRFASTADLDMIDHVMMDHVGIDEDYYRDYFEESGY